jgi:hypothetical protein
LLISRVLRHSPSLFVVFSSFSQLLGLLKKLFRASWSWLATTIVSLAELAVDNIDYNANKDTQ